MRDAPSPVATTASCASTLRATASAARTWPSATCPLLKASNASKELSSDPDLVGRGKVRAASVVGVIVTILGILNVVVKASTR